MFGRQKYIPVVDKDGTPLMPTSNSRARGWMYLSPLRFIRRQLHKLQPSTGGIRRRDGGTKSLGFKRGSLIRHPKFGIAYVGGYLKQHLSLHEISSGKRLTHHPPCLQVLLCEKCRKTS